MEERSFLDFLAAMGEEFADALSPPVEADLISPQDGHEIWRRAFGTDPSPEALTALSAPDIERLRSVAAGYLECPDLSADHVLLAVRRTLARWPAQANS